MSAWGGLRLSIEDEITIAVYEALRDDPDTQVIIGASGVRRTHLNLARLAGATAGVLVSGVQVDERVGFSALLKGEHAVAILATAEFFQGADGPIPDGQPSFASLLSHWRNVVDTAIDGARRLSLCGTTKPHRWETVVIAPEGVEGSPIFLAAGQRAIFYYDVLARDRRLRSAA